MSTDIDNRSNRLVKVGLDAGNGLQYFEIAWTGSRQTELLR
jgi:hypothetical protein